MYSKLLDGIMRESDRVNLTLVRKANDKAMTQQRAVQYEQKGLSKQCSVSSGVLA